MQRQHRPNLKLSRSQKASVFGNVFKLHHRPELQVDSLVLTCLHFSGQHVAMKGLRIKAGAVLQSLSLPIYFLATPWLCMGFYRRWEAWPRRSLQATFVPGAGPVDVEMDILGLPILTWTQYLIPTPSTPLGGFFIELLYLLQISKNQEDNITLSYVLMVLIEEGSANR